MASKLKIHLIENSNFGWLTLILHVMSIEIDTQKINNKILQKILIYRDLNHKTE